MDGHRRPTPRRKAPSAHRSAERPSAPLTRRAFLAAAGLAGVAGIGAVAACVSRPPAQSEAGAGREVVLDQDASAAPAEVSLLMVGDVLMHPSVVETGALGDGTYTFDHLFANVADEVAAADIAMVGQETILAGSVLGVSGYPAFCSPEEVGDAEVAAGFDVALCASNHACDRGMAAIEAACDFWRTEHPDTVCAGIADSAEVAEAVPVLERAGHKIAVLNYATAMNGIPLPEPWAVRMLSEDQLAADVDAARQAGAEAIVACPHWGTEYMEGPDDDQRHWAQALADAGVDVIFGGHPHVLQPFETVAAADGRTVPVFWSVGNFVSGQQRMDTMVGGMARATLSFEGGSCRVSSCSLAPVVTHRAGADPLSTYLLADYSEDQALRNGIREFSGCSGFSRQWCLDLCAERLGDAFDPTTCELVWEA